jgi:hypothetical protein
VKSPSSKRPELTLASSDFPRPMPRLRGSWIRGPRLERNDLQILRWITRHGVVTAEQVARKFYPRPNSGLGYSEWAAKNRIAALSNLGLILRNSNPYSRRRGGGQQILRASSDGARIADVAVSAAPLVMTQLRHALTLVSLTEFLLERYPGATLTTERELWVQEYRRRYHGGTAARAWRLPDAVLTIPKPAADPNDPQATISVAVELDLSRKDRRALESIIDRYNQMSFDTVWWYVKEERVEAVAAVVRALASEKRFEVLPVRWQA